MCVYVCIYVCGVNDSTSQTPVQAVKDNVPALSQLCPSFFLYVRLHMYVTYIQLWYVCMYVYHVYVCRRIQTSSVTRLCTIYVHVRVCSHLCVRALVLKWTFIDVHVKARMPPVIDVHVKARIFANSAECPHMYMCTYSAEPGSVSWGVKRVFEDFGRSRQMGLRGELQWHVVYIHTCICDDARVSMNVLYYTYPKSTSSRYLQAMYI